MAPEEGLGHARPRIPSTYATKSPMISSGSFTAEPVCVIPRLNSYPLTFPPTDPAHGGAPQSTNFDQPVSVSPSATPMGPLTAALKPGTMTAMSKLAEIEQAADSLPPEEKQELMLFLAARLRAEGARMPEPRKYTREQIQTWLAEDEAELRHFKREG
jgi:predicted component of type VI protein secretion system